MSTDWQRSVVTLAATVVTVVVILALYFARSVFIPIALSIFLAFVLVPVVGRLQRHGFGRSFAVLLTVGMVLVLTIGVGTLIIQQVARLPGTLADRGDVIKAKVAKAKSWVAAEGDGRFSQLVDDVMKVLVPKSEAQQTIAVQPEPQSFGAWVSVYVSPAAEIIGQAAFAFVLTVYMLIRREDLRNRMIKLLGDGKVTTTTKAVDEASRRISRYLLMQFLVNTSFGTIISVSLFLLGLDYALLWGFIGAVMRYIPYVGTWLGLIPPVLFSFATAPDWGGGWGQPIAVFALFAVLEAVCNNVFEPWLYGQSMGLSEVAQLVAAAFWAFLWGPIGLILSGPLTTCLLVLGKYVRRFEFLDVMLGDEPPLAAHVAFYQRLTARDQDEAAEIALKVANESGPDEAFEKVVIPALCMARRDADEGDLDANALRFVIRGAREVAGEVADIRPVQSHPHMGTRVRVLIVPARDEAEHVAADILGGTLEATQWEVRVPGDEMLASELIAAVEDFKPAVVVLVTLPPGGLSHCRYLVSRLKSKCPNVKVIVGRWGHHQDEDNPVRDKSHDIKGVDGIGRDLAETQKRLTEMGPILSAEAEKSEKPIAKRPPVGTLSA
ncbi:MAG: AI-2E family transporter [Planctomycetes bacterium]|nr:AI-2E family transporter [Planctomycetota bacterium]